jgi:predicted O-methyltransferase YrrM
MSKLAEINDKFVDDYIFNHRNNLGKPTMGGTDWRFADIVVPAFRDVLEIAKPSSVLEIGFNAGGSALMFLMIDRALVYHSIDIYENRKSIEYLCGAFDKFHFLQLKSNRLSPRHALLEYEYDMAFIDGDHSEEGVVNDIEKSLLFNPGYILLDDYRHPSHNIESILLEKYKDKLEVVKVFEFNQCWQGYSMALCKVKNA